MREITTEINIGAPPERVWSVLTDFAAYAEWNPFIVEASGRAEVGAKLSIRVRFEKRGAMHFRPVVCSCEPARALVWKGSSPVRALFDGEHRFLLEPRGARRTRLLHSERFSGLLIPVVWSGMRKPTESGFEAMNRALKKRAEKAHPV